MNVSPLKVVLVDDHDGWREQLAAMVQQTGAWQVVGTAADGPDGYALAASLKPDLILLDIELPTLNGIETATRILAADPSARILFLTGHRSWEVVEAALMTGARAYLLKNFAGQELLAAMSAVTAGRRFLSVAVGGRASGTGDHRHELHTHHAGIYTADASLEADYEACAAEALQAGKAVVGVMHPERRTALRRRLKARGVDVDRAIADDRYMELDVTEALALMVTDGLPDEARMWSIVIALMARAARATRASAPTLVAFGDCAQTLWNAGEPSAAILLEQFWNEIAKTVNLDLLCGYTLHGFEAEDEEMRGLLGAAHTSTLRR
jgi:DNA-binding NarL/FixJ family response regulator